ncbi:MAG: MoaD/ThiS family protein [Chloroflexota bacterium]|nr:MoaD/ThiS family protein [Chloroflexota bacterium]
MQVSYRDKRWEFDRRMPVYRLLEQLSLLPENVLVLRNGQLVTEDQPLQPGDEVKIIAVVSGG